MKKHLLLTIVALNLVGLLLTALFWPHLMISPGQPMAAHAEIATDCFACHSPFVGATPGQCIACHQVARIGLETVDGQPIADSTADTIADTIAKEEKRVAFHRQLLEDDCLACHSEHRGVQAFRPIGRFSHDLLQPVAREQCDGCHARPKDSLHRGVEGNCSGCHTQEAWLPASFDHDQYFRFDRHHDTECATCHVDNDYSQYTCYGCHEHSRSEIREEHWEEGIREFENCVECHRSGDEEEAEYLWRRRRSGLESGSIEGEDRNARRWDEEEEEHRGRRYHEDD